MNVLAICRKLAESIVLPYGFKAFAENFNQKLFVFFKVVGGLYELGEVLVESDKVRAVWMGLSNLSVAQNSITDFSFELISLNSVRLNLKLEALRQLELCLNSNDQFILVLLLYESLRQSLLCFVFFD